MAAAPISSLPALEQLHDETAAQVSYLVSAPNAAAVHGAQREFIAPVPDRTAEVEAALANPNQAGLEALNAQLRRDVDTTSVWESQMEFEYRDREARLARTQEYLQPHRAAEAALEQAKADLLSARNAFQQARQQWRFFDPRVREARRELAETRVEFEAARTGWQHSLRENRTLLSLERHLQQRFAYYENLLEFYGTIFERLEQQTQRVIAALDPFYAETYKYIARVHGDIVEHLSQRLAELEAEPLRAETLPDQEAGLAEFYQDLQNEDAALSAGARLTGRLTATSHEMLDPLVAELWKIRQRWHARNNEAQYLRERLCPTVIRDEVDFTPEAVCQGPRDVQAQFALPEEIGGVMRLQSEKLRIEETDEDVDIIVHGQTVIVDFHQIEALVLGAVFTIERTDGSDDWIQFQVLNGRQEVSAGNFRPGLGPIAAGGFGEGVTRIVFTVANPADSAAGLRIKELQLIRPNPLHV